MAEVFLLVVLKVVMILIFAGWISLWLLKPTDIWTRKWKEVEERLRPTILGYYGTIIFLTLCQNTFFFFYMYVVMISTFENMYQLLTLYLISFAGINFVVFTFPVIALAIIGSIYMNLQLRKTRRR